MAKKTKEVNRSNIIAHLIGGMATGMMMMSNNNRFSGGADSKLKDKILKHTVPFQKQLSKEQLEVVGKIAYETILEADGGVNHQVNPYTFVEALMFDFEKEVRGFYDGDIIDVVCRFTAKNPFDAEDSYAYAEQVKKTVRKKLYDNLKGMIL